MIATLRGGSRTAEVATADCRQLPACIFMQPQFQAEGIGDAFPYFEVSVRSEVINHLQACLSKWPMRRTLNMYCTVCGACRTRGEMRSRLVSPSDGKLRDTDSVIWRSKQGPPDLIHLGLPSSPAPGESEVANYSTIHFTALAAAPNSNVESTPPRTHRSHWIAGKHRLEPRRILVGKCCDTLPACNEEEISSLHLSSSCEFR
jgi:hypothetical protein